MRGHPVLLVAAALGLLGGCTLAREGLSEASGSGGGAASGAPTSSASSAGATSSGGGACEPGATEKCYAGPRGTEGVGACVAGARTCAADGSGFGPCEGEVVPAAEVCASAVDESCDGVASCAGDTLWSWGVLDAVENWGRAVAVDTAGAMIVATGLSGQLDFGGGSAVITAGVDVVIAKYAADGTPLFAKAFGDADFQTPTDVATDAEGNILVVGAFQGTLDLGGGPLVNDTTQFIQDAFVAKLGPGGEHVWSKQFGDASDQDAYAVATDVEGDVILAGKFAGTLDFGGAPMVNPDLEDVFVAKLGPDGERIWSRQFGDASKQEAFDVAVDSTGAVVVVGDYSGHIDFDGNDHVAFGYDGFIAKLDQNGAHLWSLGFGDYADDRAASVAIDAERNVLVAGWATGTLDLGGGSIPGDSGTDAFVAKLDPEGALLWARRFGNYDNQQAYAVAVDAAGNAVVTGQVSGSLVLDGVSLTSQGGADVFVIKLAPDGTAIWGKAYGDVGTTQWGLGVAVDTVGSSTVVGQFDGSLAFGATPLVSVGGFDLFIARLSP